MNKTKNLKLLEKTSKVRSKVVLDTDFLNILLTSERKMTKSEEDETIDFFKSIFEILNLKPVIHEYLYAQELIANPLAKRLVDEKYIEMIKKQDFLKTHSAEKLYMAQVRNFYKIMKDDKNELLIDEYDKLVFHHEAKSNLGEILSVLMAKELKLRCFFSNDKGAKNLVKNIINTNNFSINVYNVLEVFAEIDSTQGKKLNSKKRKAIQKKLENRKR